MSNQSDYDALVTSGANGRFHRLTHKSLEKKYKGLHFDRVLEIGAGSGEHLPFVLHSFSEYVMSDIELPTNKISQSMVRHVIADASSLPFDDEHFDRIVVTCVLHHVSELYGSILEMKRTLKPGGVLTILLPTDPGFVFRLSRSMMGDQILRNQGCADIDFFRSIEHRNHYVSILGILKNVFQNDDFNAFGFPFHSHFWHINLFTAIHITKRK